MGVVVGTFAAVPFIHLQLEARKRFYPSVPLLVHDDSSHKGEELAALCASYGADYERNEPRLARFRGDLTIFVGGFRWAREIQVDLLVKLSRRFVPVTGWVETLVDLAMESQYATFCSWTTTYNFGFRSECVGMAVHEWFRLNLVQAIVETALRKEEPVVEAFIHNLARHAAVANCRRAWEYDERVGARPPERNGYAVWPFMGTDRMTRYDQFLWHDAAAPADYARLAHAWGLSYSSADFSDPNQGGGDRPEAL